MFLNEYKLLFAQSQHTFFSKPRDSPIVTQGHLGVCCKRIFQRLLDFQLSDSLKAQLGPQYGEGITV